MVICGVTGRRRSAAAALVVDGRLVAAVEQAPLADRDGRASMLPEAAIDACLTAAGLTRGDVTHVVRAEGPGLALVPTPSGRASARAFGDRVAVSHLGRLAAHARLAQAAGASTVLVVDAPGVAVLTGDTLTMVDDASTWLGATVALAGALGLAADDAGDALTALEALAATSGVPERDWFAGRAIAAGHASAALAGILREAEDTAGGRLDDPSTPLVRTNRVRADLAASGLAALARQLVAAAPAGAMLAGGVWTSPEFVARVQASAGHPIAVAPCATPEGAAVGAALALSPRAALVVAESFALGAPVSEPDAKAVIENCRLDYLYEPRWSRLVERVSHLLERGKLVAFFQGPAEFGHPLFGSRSVLADPSNRYARDNVNVFLRRLPLATPIPVALAPAARPLVSGPLSPWRLSRVEVAASAREGLKAVVDGRGAVHAHVLPDQATGPFAELLTLHHQRTGVPGLVNLPLAPAGGSVAVTPRDAVRAAFGSPVDALVMHRFVVMKDYWQMHADPR